MYSSFFMTTIDSAKIRDLRKWASDMGGYDETTAEDRQAYRADHPYWKSDDHMRSYHMQKGPYADTVPVAREWVYKQALASKTTLTEQQLIKLWDKSELNGTVAISVIIRIAKRAVKKRKVSDDAKKEVCEQKATEIFQNLADNLVLQNGDRPPPIHPPAVSSPEQENHNSEDEAKRPAKKPRMPVDVGRIVSVWLKKQGRAYADSANAKQKVADFKKANANALELSKLSLTEKYMRVKSRELYPSSKVSPKTTTATKKKKAPAAAAAAEPEAPIYESNAEESVDSSAAGSKKKKPWTIEDLHRAIRSWLTKSGRTYAEHTSAVQKIDDFKQVFSGAFDFSSAVISEEYMRIETNEIFPPTTEPMQSDAREPLAAAGGKDAVADVLSDVHDEFAATANAMSPAVTQRESVFGYHEPEKAMLVNASAMLPVPIRVQPEVSEFPPPPPQPSPIFTLPPPQVPSLIPAAAAADRSVSPMRTPSNSTTISPVKSPPPQPRNVVSMHAENMLLEIEKKAAEATRVNSVRKLQLAVLKEKSAKKCAEKKEKEQLLRERVAATKQIKADVENKRSRLEQAMDQVRHAEAEREENDGWTGEYKRLEEELNKSDVIDAELKAATTEYVKAQEEMDRLIADQRDLNRRLLELAAKKQ